MATIKKHIVNYALHYRLYRLLFFLIIIGLHFIALFYGERFRFWHDPYSGLGATVTENGF